jgi:hypothetical protein
MTPRGDSTGLGSSNPVRSTSQAGFCATLPSPVGDSRVHGIVSFGTQSCAPTMETGVIYLWSLEELAGIVDNGKRLRRPPLVEQYK